MKTMIVSLVISVCWWVSAAAADPSPGDARSKADRFEVGLHLSEALGPESHELVRLEAAAFLGRRYWVAASGAYGRVGEVFIVGDQKDLGPIWQVRTSVFGRFCTAARGACFDLGPDLGVTRLADLAQTELFFGVRPGIDLALGSRHVRARLGMPIGARAVREMTPGSWRTGASLGLEVGVAIRM